MLQRSCAQSDHHEHGSGRSVGQHGDMICGGEKIVFLRLFQPGEFGCTARSGVQLVEPVHEARGAPLASVRIRNLLGSSQMRV